MSAFDAKTINEVRSYWNAQPCNFRHSLQEVGTKEYFDEIEQRKYFVEPHIPLFAEFPRWKGKRVLEVGCGLGTDTMNFARAGAKVTAVDLSDESLALAKQRAKVFGLEDRIAFYQANAEELSSVVPVEPYDLVYSFGVIHHTPHPEAVIGQIRKYMNKDSLFKIMVYNRMSWKVFWIVTKYGKGRFWKLDELVAKYSEAQTGCPVTYSYTKSNIGNLLKGLDIRKAYYEHIFPYSIPEYKQYIHKKVWYFNLMPAYAFRLFERAAGWHLCADAVLSESLV